MRDLFACNLKDLPVNRQASQYRTRHQEQLYEWHQKHRITATKWPPACMTRLRYPLCVGDALTTFSTTGAVQS